VKRERVFGLHAVRAVLENHPERVIRLFFAEGRQDKRLHELQGLADRHGLAVQRVSRKQLEIWSEGQKHQGAMAEIQASGTDAGLTESDVLELLASQDRALVLMLDGVTDPHNLGACLRTADATGVDAVIVPKDKSAGMTPVVRKVACGAAETVPLVAVTNLARFIDSIKSLGVWVIGAAGEADQSLYDVDLTGKTAVVMGAEGTGLRRLTKDKCDLLVRIPMCGTVSSLNVSVATGVMLYEALRQRQKRVNG
jgi:23S rRNA (guanosine2251-2'-O)-methyltransferase